MLERFNLLYPRSLVVQHSDLCSNHLPDVPGQLIDWVRQAGQIALNHFEHTTHQLKPDQSFLTQVDLEIERFLAERFHRVYPQYALIGEEGTRIGNADADSSIWAIDPLDGTTAFVQGLPGWGISVGLLCEGQPCLGLFYMPLLDDMTSTNSHADICHNGRNLSRTVRSDWGQKGFLATNASAHSDFYIGVRRTRTLGSVGASLAYTARGVATAAFIPKAYLWDLVAGAAILNRAGGELRYLSGKHVDYAQLLDGQPAAEPIIAGHPDLLAELADSIHPRSFGLRLGP